MDDGCLRLKCQPEFNVSIERQLVSDKQPSWSRDSVAAYYHGPGGGGLDVNFERS